MNKIIIIGAGFTGTMTAVQLVNKAAGPLELIVISGKETINKGVAYNPYSKSHLLNVITAKMSAFPDKPDDFLDWVMQRPEFSGKDRALVANSFLPRYIYGKYLTDVWSKALDLAKQKKLNISIIEGFAVDVDVYSNSVSVLLDNNEKIEADYCIIATGNNIPGNPNIKDNSFFKSKNYFQNPWLIDSVACADSSKPVLIIGNGLTMVDTVLGLLENGFKGEIYSISPNGFNVLPHRHGGLKYTKFAEELPEDPTLFEIVRLFNKHIKIMREFGVSAEPVVDSIRPHTQQIWKKMSLNEKQVFMSRLRHLWGVARHRIPTHIHDRLQQLRIDGKLHVKSGKITDISETESSVTIEYYDKKESSLKKIEVSRVINCTGPDTNLENLNSSFLKNCLLKGTIVQDELKLGIIADTKTFEVLNKNGERQPNLFTLGSNLKGELWESTAVNELRSQAESLAESITLKRNNRQE